MREDYKVVALLLKPSLGLLGLVGRRRVLLPHPGSATGHLIAPGDHHTLRHIQVHFGVDFHPGHVPVICGNPDLHFEGASNGPVVITWIGREHELYSGVSPMSFVSSVEKIIPLSRDSKINAI